MFRSWLIATALLIAIYCFLIYIRNVVAFKRKHSDSIYKPGVSLLFMVRNQQDIIEGILRKALSEACCRPAEVVAVDLGSTDQTQLIMQHLTIDFPNFRLFTCGEGSGVVKIAGRLCRGDIIYCFDLCGPVKYNLLSRAVGSVLNGSGTNMYRTVVLYKNETLGRCDNTWKFGTIKSGKMLPRDKG